MLLPQLFGPCGDSPDVAGKVKHGMLLQQPWARLVAEGVFPVLVRSTATTKRGRVGVIARGVDRSALVDGGNLSSHEFPQPALIGYVEIIDCFGVPLHRVTSELKRCVGLEFSNFYPRHYLPTKAPVYFWVLGNARLLRKSRRVSNLRSRVWTRSL